jgi:hypothetical protein
VVPLAAFFGLAWVAGHLIEVAVTCGACGALAVAAVVAIMRWQDRRQAARGPLMTYRTEATQISRPPADPGPAGIRHAGADFMPRAIEAPAVHFHFHGLPDDRQAAIIRQAIPGTAADALTEEK